MLGRLIATMLLVKDGQNSRAFVLLRRLIAMRLAVRKTDKIKIECARG